MYNEAEKMILDSIVECSYCGASGKDIKFLGLSTTIVASQNWEDENHNKHEHDNNCIDAHYECINGHKFKIKPINSCWCGWRQDPFACMCAWE